jgi:hypothetical protein
MNRLVTMGVGSLVAAVTVAGGMAMTGAAGAAAAPGAASARGRVVTKRQLLVEVWDQPYGGTENTVDVHLSWLRRKLGETATAPRYLRTVHGVGVRLVDPTAVADEQPDQV